jgi:hypothetical protein
MHGTGEESDDPLINKAPRYEDYELVEVIGPRVLDRGTMWK